ncbi:MAG: type III pantothenate kinase [Kiritimatiellae bacterium]|nr:type III pantothenate kinase [Verrucomicrobiota bacterium]MCG2661044.1 type III pantothenate kinase [Kiritimatiellia bacterium]
MSEFVIVVDMGNTSTTVGLARAGRISGIRRLPTRTTCRTDVTAALTRLTRNRLIAGAMLCSVVPQCNHLWLRELQAFGGRPPRMLHHRMKLGLRIAYPNPASIGADRLANACGAAHRYGSPVIVADFGTALTFDVVANNAYMGGIIVPGLPLMTDYLAEKTALLPRLRLDRYHGIPRDLRTMPVIGKNTRQAMAIGARLGYLGMVREIFTRLQHTLKSRAVRLCATGSYAAWVLAECDLPVHLDPDLTLYGIARIYELNR